MPADLDVKPLISVPTTSGSGSEVARWGTIWGDDQIKYSVNDLALYPSDSILDPEFCVIMPKILSIATGLDALSHAIEAIWNVNATYLTDAIAQRSIRLLCTHLEQVLDSPSSVEVRRQIQVAATLSGMAMGVTQTAACHSISYPFTSRYDLPHGIACSFTLAEMASYIGETCPD